jgi:hypothetical protein
MAVTMSDGSSEEQAAAVATLLDLQEEDDIHLDDLQTIDALLGYGRD